MNILTINTGYGRGGRMLKYSELKPYEQCAVRIGMAIIGVKDIKTAILEEIKADRLCARCWKRADKCECGNGY